MNYIARASWAVASVALDGEVLATVKGVVHASLPQTPQAAEFAAFCAAADISTRDFLAFSDCANVVQADSSRGALRYHARYAYSAVVRQRDAVLGGNRCLGTLKVKSHRRSSEAVNSVYQVLIRGNDHVDIAAGEAAAAHPSVQEQIDEVADLVK
ncbi:MAG: hypothetical protein ACKPKO_16610, partial [Candidatus Fonsibacter sp.]